MKKSLFPVIFPSTIAANGRIASQNCALSGNDTHVYSMKCSNSRSLVNVLIRRVLDVYPSGDSAVDDASTACISNTFSRDGV